MDELLTDLDILCSVVGIGASSRMIEASSVAWSDAFLDAVTAGSTLDPSTRADSDSAQRAAVDEVARRLAGFRPTVWGDLAPSGRLLLITWSSESAADRLVEELSRVGEEVRRIFPGAVVAQQLPQRRVIAAVADSSGTEAKMSSLRARCAELVSSATPTVTIAEAPTDGDIARLLFRSAG